MAERTLGQHIDHIAKAMKDIDFVMLGTHTKGGEIGHRPMSNNREVDYDGDSYYFTWEDCLMVEDIKRNSKIGLSLQGRHEKGGAPGIFISVEGHAKIIRDRAQFEQHWSDDLNRWFKDGVETDEMVLIHVEATRAAYWDGEDEADFDIPRTL